MAVLQKIRKNLVAQLAIGLGMVAFIVTGFVTCSRGPREMESVVTELNGEELGRQDFDNQVEEYKNILRIVQNKPLDYNFSSEEEASIRESVWQRFVQKNLLEEECNKLGLTVTDNELASIIKEGTHPLLTQIPLFVAQDRSFDYASLQQFLLQYNTMRSSGQVSVDQLMQMELIHNAWIFIEKELRTAVLSEKYQNLLCSLTLSNPVSAKANFDARHNETDVLMAFLPYTSIADADIQVSDSELKAKLNEYKDAYWRNPNTNEMVAFYNLHEAREIKYIDVNIRPSQADQQNLNDDMNSYAEALAKTNNFDSLATVAKSAVAYTKLPMSIKAIRRIDAEAAKLIDSMTVGQVTAVFSNPMDTTLNVMRLIARSTRPDSIEVRDIAIANLDIDAAKATADSIIRVLAAGEEFDSVAKHLNQTSDKHWIYGNMYEGTALSEQDQEYIETVLNTGKGELKTITMDGGVVLLQVTDRRQMEEKYDVAIIKRKVDFSQETFKQYMTDLSTFVNNCKDAQEIEEKAVEAGYLLQQETVYKNTRALTRVSGTREIVRWAFNEETQLGNILDPKAYGNNSDHIVMAILTNATPAGSATLDDEKTQNAIGQMVVRDKKVAMLQEKMKDAKQIADVAKLEGAMQDTIQHITFASAAYILNAGTQEIAVSGAATALPEGKFVSGIRGNAGVYALQAIKKSANAEAYNEQEEMKSHAMQGASILVSMFQMNPEDYNSIFYPTMKSGKLKDNRNIFF